MWCAAAIPWERRLQPISHVNISKFAEMASSVLEYKVSLGTILTAAAAAGGLAYLYTVANRKAESEGTLTRQENNGQGLGLDTNVDTARRGSYFESYTPQQSPSRKKKKAIRVFMEGAFDVMHYGHANAFRLGKQLGTTLVVGVNSSETIEAAKGAPPLMTDEERCASVRACKFVDEVIVKTPYVMTREYLDWVIKTYDIDYVVHGDDPCYVDGVDVYGHVKERGMFRSIPRTEGVSTSEIIGRMLLMTNSHHQRKVRAHVNKNGEIMEKIKNSTVSKYFPKEEHLVGYYRTSQFHLTSRIMHLFSHPHRAIEPGMKVVYVVGGWDMFHAGHVEILKAAKQLGDYLLVGIDNDAKVNRHRGLNFPIMNIQERTLSVLQCKYVDDVIIDPPWNVSEEFIAALNISVVVRGTIDEDTNTDRESVEHHDQFYKGALNKGMLKVIKSPSNLTVTEIVSRVVDNKAKLTAKINKKMKTETEFYKEKHGLGNDFQFGTSTTSSSGSVKKN